MRETEKKRAERVAGVNRVKRAETEEEEQSVERKEKER